ncbi:hypothetical protein JYU34_007889 [Plutella xylostella]|uniref:Uncharacterized protein n=1 Tax=Plutella xylostella TaxID=51655 RepID=A0ABQ7QRL7_PLUXY|nr:hypothetical protein JYU34_007889 [Plutella xylostella]
MAVCWRGWQTLRERRAAGSRGWYRAPAPAPAPTPGAPAASTRLLQFPLKSHYLPRNIHEAIWFVHSKIELCGTCREYEGRRNVFRRPTPPPHHTCDLQPLPGATPRRPGGSAPAPPPRPPRPPRLRPAVSARVMFLAPTSPDCTHVYPGAPPAPPAPAPAPAEPPGGRIRKCITKCASWQHCDKAVANKAAANSYPQVRDD